MLPVNLVLGSEGCPLISKSSQPHNIDAKCLFQPRPQTLHNITENELLNCHETHPMVTSLEDLGKFKCWTVLPQQMWTMLIYSPRNACQKDSEWFQILQVIWGNIWYNESHKINGSSILEGGHTDLPWLLSEYAITEPNLQTDISFIGNRPLPTQKSRIHPVTPHLALVKCLSFLHNS